MTLKELIEYENMLCSLQQEYEGKLTKIYGEADSSSESYYWRKAKSKSSKI